MPAGSYARLQRLLHELGTLLEEAPGPDLGDSADNHVIRYLPAYQRYAGTVYCRSSLRELYLKAQGVRALIVSALYGLLDADDAIRWYDVAMDSTLRNGARVTTWWKQHHLGALVKETIVALRPQHVHDLLPGNYRTALAPWPPADLVQPGLEFVPHNYPGQGSGSQWARGDQLKCLLVDSSVSRTARHHR